MSSFLYGLHDRQAAAHVPDGGWCVDTIALSENPAPQVYDPRINWIVRTNFGYGSTGTIPTPDKYPQFAAACASWAARSKGVEWYIISNEPNGEWERPNGVIITPEDYARCFLLCSKAIKQAAPGAKVMHAAIGPYHASPTPWHHYLRQVLQIIAPSGLCDALNFHAYARSMNSDELLSQVKMDAPLRGKYYGFLTILDAVDEVPPSMLNLPAFITEFDVYGGWENQNTGIITAMYDWVNDWNSDKENLPKFQGSVNFRWLGPPDVENVHDWGMRDKPQLLNDFLGAVAKGYKSPVQGATNVSTQTHIPVVSPGTSNAEPSLPPRNIDPRLVNRGVTVNEVTSSDPNHLLWKIVSAQFFNEQESGGRHHIYVEALDENGKPVNGIPFLMRSQGSPQQELKTNGRTFFDATNVPMWASEGKNGYSIKFWEGDTITGLGMGDDTPDEGFNAGIHTSILVKAQQKRAGVTVPQPTKPTIVSPGPTPVPQPEPPVKPVDLWIVTTVAANIRKHPSLDAQVLKVFPQGTRLKAVGEVGEWYQAVGGRGRCVYGV